VRQEKPYDIPKRLVWQAYKDVRASRGAAGCDAQTIAQFDENRDRNLYKIWNRLSSGSYFPPPVLKQEIPKPDGRKRVLGIPTVTDRIAQGAVKLCLEQILEPKFHPDSYGYRPGRSAHDALEKTRQRLWKYDWVVEIDIRAFFDTVSHELILKALRYHGVPIWAQLYAKRWLEAEMVDRDGNRQQRDKGTPQGGVISPLLANLFLHHGLDKWMERHHPRIPFARYADDAVLHCLNSRQADEFILALQARMEDIGLELHPEKTRKVYVGRANPREAVEREFTFLGYDFKRRVLRKKDGELFYRVFPGASKKAMKEMTKVIRGWRIHRSSGMTIWKVAQSYNATLRGWINYYGRYWYRHFGYRLWSTFQSRLVRWARCRYKLSQRAAEKKLKVIRQHHPNLFAHWELLGKQEGRSSAV
jgi:group II intron reverse transcriptase/maturase